MTDVFFHIKVASQRFYKISDSLMRFSTPILCVFFKTIIIEGNGA